MFHLGYPSRKIAILKFMKYDYKKALLDPSSVFKSPADVVNSPNFTKKQKIKILHRWEYDMREQEVAVEENMPTGPYRDILDKIILALLELGVNPCLEHSAPTKQGGEEEE